MNDRLQHALNYAKHLSSKTVAFKRRQSDNAGRDERRLHHLLRSFKHRGEWFKLPDSLIAMMVKSRTVAELIGDKL